MLFLPTRRQVFVGQESYAQANRALSDEWVGVSGVFGPFIADPTGQCPEVTHVRRESFFGPAQQNAALAGLRPVSHQSQQLRHMQQLAELLDGIAPTDREEEGSVNMFAARQLFSFDTDA